MLGEKEESGKIVRSLKLLTIESTRSTFRSKKQEGEKIQSMRKNLSISIKYTSPSRSLSSPLKHFQSLPQRGSFSQPPKKSRLNISNLVPLRPQISQLPELTCTSMCALFTDSPEIFLSKNASERRQIASLTKIMTAFTVINICNTYGVKIRETTVTVEREASMMEGTSANLRNGDKFFVIDLLYGLLLPSGNDAALALAQYFGKFLSFAYSTKKYQTKEKSDEKINQFEEMKDFYDAEYNWESIRLFVFEMNKNCLKMKLKNTRFSNPTGLSDAGNYSTSHDMARLISFCLKNHLLSLIFKKKVYSCTAINQKLGLQRLVQWRNTNKHLFSIRDCIGVKTGITPTAGPCLSTAYRFRGKELIIVILNSRSIDERYLEAQRVYKYAKAQFSQQQTQ